MHGLHLTADLYGCACDLPLMCNEAILAEVFRSKTLAAGLTLVGEHWHRFPGPQEEAGGVTGMLLLAESHVAVHTWPERQGVTLDVYVCNVSSDNSQKAESLMKELVAAFKPGQSQLQRLWRGDLSQPAQSTLQGELVMEGFNNHSVFGFRFDRRLESRQSDFQAIELLESAHLGRTLRLDGRFMTSEADEFFYHEAMTHPAAIAHPEPRRALVIGGGDGGAVEELLKHPSITEVLLVEIDAEVVDVARTYLHSIHRGALDDPRVSVRHEDGAAFIKTCCRSFDLIVLDLTDPETLAGPLYTRAFFADCKKVLAPGGAMTLHLGSPFHEPERVRGLAAQLTGLFSQVHCYGLHVPLYGAYWAFAVVSDLLLPTALNAAQVRWRMEERGIQGLHYYNPDVHGALFALPNYYRSLVTH